MPRREKMIFLENPQFYKWRSWGLVIITLRKTEPEFQSSFVLIQYLCSFYQITSSPIIWFYLSDSKEPLSLFLGIKPEVQKNHHMHVRDRWDWRGQRIVQNWFSNAKHSSSFVGGIGMHICTTISTYGHIREHCVLNIP